MLQINITANLGTLNVAAEVEGVKIKGDGEMHMMLSSSLLPNMNRQLQFVTYTNTLFHPSTADTGKTSIVLGFLRVKIVEKMISKSIQFSTFLCFF